MNKKVGSLLPLFNVHWFIGFLHFSSSLLVRMPLFHSTSFRSIVAIAAFLFDACVPLVVVASTIDQHHAPQSVKMEQLILAVASLFVLSCGRDYLEQRFEKVLCSLEDVVDSAQ
jgi:hypothetical protein